MTPGSAGPLNTGHHGGDNVNAARDVVFAAAWSAFANDDAGADAPPALESRVREAARQVCARRHATHLAARRQRIIVALGTAATFAVVAAGLPSRNPVADKPAPSVDVPTGINAEPQQQSAAAVTGDGNRVATVPNGEFPDEARRPNTLVTLAVDPVQDTEQLALVHIRVSQDALLALGIATNEPGTSGLVDVEVLVGGDGLPRDIRRMRTVLTNEASDQ